MSARELLEQIKSLPPRERQRVFVGVHALEKKQQSTKSSTRKRRVRWPDAAARRRRIFGDKTLPNLVLMAREEERC